MSTNKSNRKRVFADLVSIDAWHAPFTDIVSRADLHLDVVFGTARAGGESDSPVRFRLSLKRATIVIVVPEYEPVGVDRNSVSRDSPELEGKIKETVQKTIQAGAKAGANLSISPTKQDASVTAAANAEINATTSSSLETSRSVRQIVVTQSKTADGHYMWSVVPQTEACLEGRPWMPKEPRLTLIDNRNDRSKGIPPVVRVEVRCLREDLIIEDIEIKDQTKWDALKAKMGFENRLKAAEAYIRNTLANEGLEVSNVSDLFGAITLGSTSAEHN